MKVDLINAINGYKIFKKEEYMDMGLGLEIQDFVTPDLSRDQEDKILNFYIEALRGFKGIKSLHGPFIDLMPTSPDPAIKEASRIRYERTFKIAKKLDVEYLIFHSQINPDIMSPIMVEVNSRQNREFWHDILNKMNFQGMVLLENVFERTPYELLDLIETVNHKDMGIILDIGHAKLGGLSLEKWIFTLKDHIKYIHIHTNNGIYDDHNRIEDWEILRLFEYLDKYSIKPKISWEYKVEDLAGELDRFKELENFYFQG